MIFLEKLLTFSGKYYDFFKKISRFLEENNFYSKILWFLQENSRFLQHNFAVFAENSQFLYKNR